MEILDFPKKNGSQEKKEPETPPSPPTPPKPEPSPEDRRRVQIARKVVTEMFGPQTFQVMKELQATTLHALQKQCTQMTVDPRMIQALIQMNGTLALELGNRILKEHDDAKQKIQTRPAIIVP